MPLPIIFFLPKGISSKIIMFSIMKKACVYIVQFKYSEFFYFQFFCFAIIHTRINKNFYSWVLSLGSNPRTYALKNHIHCALAVSATLPDILSMLRSLILKWRAIFSWISMPGICDIMPQNLEHHQDLILSHMDPN